MAGATPILTLPYPTPDDNVDVPRDVKALADKLDTYTSLRPPLVSSLPGTPVDGQECYYLADATNGVIWHLRYRAAAIGTFKWELIGGSDLFSRVEAAESTASAAFVDLTTVGPQITVPLAGDYLVTVGTNLYTSAAATVVMSYAIGATAAIDDDGATYNTSVAGNFNGASISAQRLKTGLAGATALTAKYRTGVSGPVFRWRWMRVTPRRVG